MGEKNKVDAADILVKRTNDMFQAFCVLLPRQEINWHLFHTGKAFPFTFLDLIEDNIVE